MITIGRIVVYALTLTDSEMINRRRTNGGAISEALRQTPPAWHRGAQAHVGEHANDGDELPLLITRVNPNGTVNGQVFLNGNDTLFVQRIEEGTDKGSWKWPTRAPVASESTPPPGSDAGDTNTFAQAAEPIPQNGPSPGAGPVIEESKLGGQPNPIGTAPVSPDSNADKEAARDEQENNRTND